MLTTNINFPSQLPNPLRENHSLQAVQPFARTQLASGRSMQRKSFSNVPTQGVWEYIFTDQQAQIFESWFRDSLNDGAAWFNAKRKTPLGISSLVCRFTAMYTGPTLLGPDRWRFACPIEIIERPLLPPGWGLFPDYISGADIIDLAANREWPRS